MRWCQYRLRRYLELRRTTKYMMKMAQVNQLRAQPSLISRSHQSPPGNDMVLSSLLQARVSAHSAHQLQLMANVLKLRSSLVNVLLMVISKKLRQSLPHEHHLQSPLALNSSHHIDHRTKRAPGRGKKLLLSLLHWTLPASEPVHQSRPQPQPAFLPINV